MIKKMVLFCMAFLMSFGIAAGVCADSVSAEELEKDVRNSVVVVYTCMDLNNYQDQGFGWGTGFFVGDTKSNPEYIITNHHVIKDFLAFGGGELVEISLGDDGTSDIGKSKIRIYFDSNYYEEAYVMDYNESKDLAILKLASPTDKRQALKLCKEVTEDMVGTTAFAVGYPGLAENLFTDAVSSWGMTDASVTSGLISRLVTTSGTGVRQIQTDAVIQQGNSGGPLVNRKGSVIGINVSYVSAESETTYYAINVEELKPMLISNGIPFEPEVSTDMVVDIRIIIAVIAVIAVIAIAALAVILNKRKRNQDSVVIPQQTKNPVVRSMAAQHAGAVFPLKGQQVMIGRSSACAIIFREGTPGVSARHCSLGWDEAAGEFLLTDLNSTYGTFLANGQKLDGGVVFRLKVGDSFYLGQNTNQLRVELE